MIEDVPHEAARQTFGCVLRIIAVALGVGLALGYLVATLFAEAT